MKMIADYRVHSLPLGPLTAEITLDMHLIKRPISRIIPPTFNRSSSVSHFILCLSVFALTFICSALPASAQAPDARVKFFIASPEDEPLTVGDRLTLRLEVNHPNNTQVDLPEVGEQWGVFEVVDQTEAESVDNNDGTATTGKNIVVTIFEPGEFQTPSLVVTHHLPDGTQEELGTPVIQLDITSVLTDDTELRDLKPQAELPVPPIWPWVIAILLLSMFVIGLLAGLGLWLYHRYRRRAVPVLAPMPFIDSRPPEVIAYAELDRIEALDLPARNQIKEYYSLVDLCLRQYIEGRYDIPALEQTSTEVRGAFRRSSILAEIAAEFMEIFLESDLVKFARYVPHADNVNGLINRARAIVEATTPVVIETPEALAPEADPTP